MSTCVIAERIDPAPGSFERKLGWTELLVALVARLAWQNSVIAVPVGRSAGSVAGPAVLVD